MQPEHKDYSRRHKIFNVMKIKINNLFFYIYFLNKHFLNLLFHFTSFNESKTSPINKHDLKSPATSRLSSQFLKGKNNVIDSFLLLSNENINKRSKDERQDNRACAFEI